MSEGIVFVAYGEPARQCVRQAIDAIHYFYDPLPAISVVGDQELPPDSSRGVEAIIFDSGESGRWAKLNVDILSPYDHTLYLDADTIIRSRVDVLFDMLRAGWELVIVPSQNQNSDDHLWHVGKLEREETYDQIGFRPVQLQGGVFGFRDTPGIRRLFAYWRMEWNLWQDQDQAALLRAFYRNPVTTLLLSRHFNGSGGATVIEHRFGRARA